MKDQEFESVLRDALCPQVNAQDAVTLYRQARRGKQANMKQIMKKVCIAAAAIAVLTTTVCAAGEINISTLRSGMMSRRCSSVVQAEEKAGFRMDDLDCFTNGYAVDSIRVEEVQGLDEKDEVCLVYSEICMELKNAAGERLHLSAYQDREGLEASSVSADQVRQFGDITLEYRLHHYKFVPADYVQTEKDKLWLQQPGNFMSYGSEKGISERNVAFLNWEKEGICYLLMDSDGSEEAESLFSMAEELIRSGK